MRKSQQWIGLDAYRNTGTFHGLRRSKVFVVLPTTRWRMRECR